MNRELLNKLVNEAGQMALANQWEEDALTLNKRILEIDSSNSAACTRLAKYFMLHDNVDDAKDMYTKALELNPNNQGARNNLLEIERSEDETLFLKNLATGREAYDAARSLSQKGKYQLSIKCLIKAYSIEPIVKHAVSLGKIYSKIGKVDEVRKLYSTLLDTDQSPKNLDLIHTEFKALLHG